MSNQLVAGVDCSTQSTKVLIVDVSSGEVVATGRADHDVTSGADGTSETHPDVWFDALRDALAQTGRAADIGAISIGGQQHGLVLSDANGNVLRPAILWNDTRSSAVMDDLIAAMDGPKGWAAAIGSAPATSFTVTSLAWLRQHEPEVVKKTATIRLPHDWLTEQLTGNGTTDRGDASGSGWWSPANERYVDEILALPQVDVDPAMLPTVLGPDEIAGNVTAAAAERLGLTPGIKVGPGTGDNMAAALGLGVDHGTPVMSLGTSGTAYVTSSTPTADATGVVSGFASADGNYLPLVCTLNCTLAIDKTAEWLGIDRNDAAGSTDAVMLPYFDGERTPALPLAAGTLIGLRHNTTKGEILRAAYEGAVASLLSGLDVMAQAGAEVAADAPIVLLGGGARGERWRDVILEASGRSLLLPDADELVALGAAVQATTALTGHPAADITTAWDTAKGTVIEPTTHNPAIVERVTAATEALNAVLTRRW